MHSAANNPMSSLDIFRILTIAGAEGNKLDTYGNNVLMLYLLVATPPALETINFLQRAGSEIKHTNKMKWNALHFAAANP